MDTEKFLLERFRLQKDMTALRQRFVEQKHGPLVEELVVETLKQEALAWTRDLAFLGVGRVLASVAGRFLPQRLLPRQLRS